MNNYIVLKMTGAAWDVIRRFLIEAGIDERPFLLLRTLPSTDPKIFVSVEAAVWSKVRKALIAAGKDLSRNGLERKEIIDAVASVRLQSRIKLRLAVDVAYDLNGEDVAELDSRLYNIPRHAAGRGWFTGGTDAEVDEWGASVGVVSAPGKVYRKPLTEKQVAALVDKDGYMEVIVPVELRKVILADGFDGFNEIIDEKTGVYLTDIVFKAVGTDADGKILVHVRGCYDKEEQ